MMTNAIILFSLVPAALSQIIKNDVCKKDADERFCPWLDVRWTYLADINECQLYYGCDTVGNVFDTEESCYSKCEEKLIVLHPPQNVTSAFTHNKVYLYWYPPMNFDIHDEPVHEISSETGSNGTTTDTGKNENVTKVTTSSPVNTTDVNDKANKTDTTDSSINNNNANGTDDSTNDDSKSTNSTKPEGNVKTTAAPKVTTSTQTKKVEIALAGTNLNISDFYGKTKVPFHMAVLTHYNISIRQVNGPFLKNITVPINVTEYQVQNLQPSVVYNITVSAVYLTKTAVPAKPILLTTRQDPSLALNCFCDAFGSKEGKKSCNLSLTQTPWCNCKHGYAGLFCEVCAHGFYRTAMSLPCHPCPCSDTASTGSCHFVEGYLHCTTCKEEYTGNLCHRCANGYYRDHSVTPSRCIKCEGCHNVIPGPVCDQFTGKCLNCFYNTTGDKCEKCRDGFEGNPLKNIPCKKIAQAGYHPPAAGVIAAIVIGILVLLSGVVAFIIYKRMNNFPSNKPFWTIEFKEDHDKVNFSAVPEDEIERQHDDMAFYETQSRNKNKSPPYSQLREEM